VQALAIPASVDPSPLQLVFSLNNLRGEQSEIGKNAAKRDHKANDDKIVTHDNFLFGRMNPRACPRVASAQRDRPAFSFTV
jgi:hypothetical protein